MTSFIKCPQCNAELLPEANFCRRCGLSLETSGAIDSSELPTEVLTNNTSQTRELNPRSTSPDRSLVDVVASGFAAAKPVKEIDRRRSVLIGSAVLVFVFLAVIAAISYLRISSPSHTTEDTKLMYPGAQTIVDLTSGDGRALQLQTSDSLDQVIAWYEASIKPTKTMRLTSNSVVLKNANVTATLAAEDGKTNILIKRVR